MSWVESGLISKVVLYREGNFRVNHGQILLVIKREVVWNLKLFDERLLSVNNLDQSVAGVENDYDKD